MKGKIVERVRYIGRDGSAREVLRKFVERDTGQPSIEWKQYQRGPHPNIGFIYRGICLERTFRRWAVREMQEGDKVKGEEQHEARRD